MTMSEQGEAMPSISETRAAGNISRTHGKYKDSTHRAYERDVQRFCSDTGSSIPSNAEKVWAYIAANRTKVSPRTLHRRLMAIAAAHRAAGYPSPLEDPALKEASRRLHLGIVPPKSPAGLARSTAAEKKKEPRQAKPITRSLLERMEEAMGNKPLDLRDRCLILLGFLAALSRSELVRLDVADLQFGVDALVIAVRPEEGGEPRRVSIPVTNGPCCGARAAKRWIEHMALEDGPLFRRFDRAGDPTAQRLDAAWVSVVVKQRLRAVGVDPSAYSGLSLKKGRVAEIGRGRL